MLSLPEKIPLTPGVYFFKKNERVLYVGKAANLRNRLRSYWRKNSTAKTASLLREADRIEWIEAESDIDALLKEAAFIKIETPKYNVSMRDDKNYFYVGITDEEFPKVFVTHQRHMSFARIRRAWGRGQRFTERVRRSTFLGHFTSGAELRAVLKLLRKIFPYCTCRVPHKRPCLNVLIGRCPGPCCVKTEGADMSMQKKISLGYRENISRLAAVLKGKRLSLLKSLKKNMREAAKAEDFEKAARLRDMIFFLGNIFRHGAFLEKTPRLFMRRETWRKIERALKTILGRREKISRVEGYDISNLSGKEATGSLVVFGDGEPLKKEYRMFRIKTVAGPDDVAMHQEIMRRRLRHREWPYPDFMLIDGGKPQLHAVSRVLREHSDFSSIGLGALAKREEELYIEGRRVAIRLKALPAEILHFFQRVRDESHRFAKKYHHKLREKSYREESHEEGKPHKNKI
jgi:excinuclease ABC subunit C